MDKEQLVIKWLNNNLTEEESKAFNALCLNWVSIGPGSISAILMLVSINSKRSVSVQPSSANLEAL